MSARRVGFGDENGHARKPQAPHRDAGAKAEAAEPDAKEMSKFGKFILSLFLIAWLIGWSMGLYEMSGLVPNSFARGDWFSLGFGLVWLTFGGLGWLFALVLLFAVLFGKKPDPDNPSPLRKRLLARKAARDAALSERSRD